MRGPDPISAQLRAELSNLIGQGHAIEAVKRLRSHGHDLRASKEVVELIMREDFPAQAKARDVFFDRIIDETDDTGTQ